MIPRVLFPVREVISETVPA